MKDTKGWKRKMSEKKKVIMLGNDFSGPVEIQYKFLFFRNISIIHRYDINLAFIHHSKPAYLTGLKDLKEECDDCKNGGSMLRRN